MLTHAHRSAQPGATRKHHADALFEPVSVLLALVAVTSAEPAGRREAARKATTGATGRSGGPWRRGVRSLERRCGRGDHQAIRAPGRPRSGATPARPGCRPETRPPRNALAPPSQRLALPQEEARVAGLSEVAPAHLLLGLLRKGVAIRVHDPRRAGRPGPSEVEMRQSIEREHLMIALAHDPSPVVTRLFTASGPTSRRFAARRSPGSSHPPDPPRPHPSPARATGSRLVGGRTRADGEPPGRTPIALRRPYCAVRPGLVTAT
jgi:hypothetical protein